MEVLHAINTDQLFLKNDRTGEYIRVTADPTTNTIAIARALGSSVAAAILDNDQWVVVTLGKDEGASASRAAYEEPEVFITE